MGNKLKLYGFNNLTKSLSFNIYDVCYAKTAREQKNYIAYIDEQYNSDRITNIMTNLTEMIGAKVLSVSKQDYDPQGASVTFLIAEGSMIPAGGDEIVAHLDKSHVTVHTYPEYHPDTSIATFRVDIDVATCGEITPLSTLDYLISNFDSDIITMDYRVRGFTRDVDGKKLSDMKREQLAVFRRRKVGFVFQNYNLVPDLNVYENVVLPIELDGKRIDRPFVREILELLQIADKREALPGMLSGGQQQRVAIARAVAAKPAIILADEPTGNLDTASGHDVMGLLKVAAKQFQQTVILITHDRDIAQMADRIVHIEDGRIVGAGDPDDKVSGGEAGDPYAGE